MTTAALHRESRPPGTTTAAAPRPFRENLRVRLTSAWDHHWFGEVAAIRPFLLMKALWCVVAFDVWMNRVPLGGRYGAGDFGVAHFRWLDNLQPLPTPGLYVGIMLAVGMLALVCVFTDAARWVRALVALLYTYGWAMSMHDGYQHHYFLSLALVLFIFFPRLRASDLFPAANATAGKRRRPRLSEPVSRRVSAWGYSLLGATVGIVYAYTAMTKLDAEWWAGDVMGRLGRRSFGPIAARLAESGLPAEIVWLMSGLSVFALECLVAVGYVLAVRRDRTRSRRLRTLTWLAFFAAVGFHVSAETVLRLRIGWFSYYMIVLACVFFLPSTVLYRLGALLSKPFARLAALGRSLADRPRMSRPALKGLAVVAIAVILAASGRSLDLPGSALVGLVAAAAIVVATFVRRRQQDALRYAVATGLAGMLMWVSVGQSDVRPVYHTFVGRDLQKRGDLAGAADAFARAKRYAPDDRTIARYARRVEREMALTEN